jgi:hypothetical protein
LLLLIAYKATFLLFRFMTTRITWNDITLAQIIKICQIEDDANIPDLFDKRIAMTAVLQNLTLDELEEKYSYQDPLLALMIGMTIDVLNKPCPMQYKTRFTHNTKRYKIEYNLSKIPGEQATRLNLLNQDFYDLHEYMACIVYPVNRFGRRKAFDFEKHKQEILDIPFTYVAGASYLFHSWAKKVQLKMPLTPDLSNAIAYDNEIHFPNIKEQYMLSLKN